MKIGITCTLYESLLRVLIVIELHGHIHVVVLEFDHYMFLKEMTLESKGTELPRF